MRVSFFIGCCKRNGTIMPSGSLDVEEGCEGHNTDTNENNEGYAEIYNRDVGVKTWVKC